MASVDLGVSDQGRIASAVDNSLFIPGRTLVDIGGRYRFTLGKSKATLRVSVSNLFDVYAYDYNGPMTFDYIPGRQVSAYLAIDI
ncbi:hypothetical protein Sj15T_11960 [Sphingobium sp. TA15]|uniref:TonB-dependent receptor-like protein n=1 Tax=Sphingobium indicum (strain DSM 16413 / CCM 7287 / MTCC 6362 / UT26 / NBRC 101211 / UT26S) TaxID=452662 RepID=D4Z2A8_SPHIU|nr:TonB-dependent receptor [Sphingobium indicum]BAI96740.1 TonB-dependent receptor-like protein [Sphingobium indicum UT26S]BDD66175.1 hypothetical protein Sj15T_11960 [Sphingobium sp. TA15]